MVVVVWNTRRGSETTYMERVFHDIPGEVLAPLLPSPYRLLSVEGKAQRVHVSACLGLGLY